MAACWPKPAAVVLKQSDLVHAAPATMPAAATMKRPAVQPTPTYAQKWRSARTCFPRARAANLRTKIFSTIA